MMYVKNWLELNQILHQNFTSSYTLFIQPCCYFPAFSSVLAQSIGAKVSPDQRGVEIFLKELTAADGCVSAPLYSAK